MPTRVITIEVVDGSGRPLPGVSIAVTIDGSFAGSIQTGSDSQAVTLEVDSAATVTVVAELLGQQQGAVLAPDSSGARLVFGQAPHFAGTIPAIARCPDGTTGSPCVICRKGSATWKMCA
jgi:hypothetical protein